MTEEQSCPACTQPVEGAKREHCPVCQLVDHSPSSLVQSNDHRFLCCYTWHVFAEHTTGNWPFTGGSSVFVDTVPPEVWDQFAPLLMSRVVKTSTFTRAVLIGAGGHQRLLPNNHTGGCCCIYYRSIMGPMI
jgi:hypothetical protein